VIRVAVGPGGPPAPGQAAAGRGPSRRWAILLGAPLSAVVLAGLWTPSPLAAALQQVVLVLGGGRG